MSGSEFNKSSLSVGRRIYGTDSTKLLFRGFHILGLIPLHSRRASQIWFNVRRRREEMIYIFIRRFRNTPLPPRVIKLLRVSNKSERSTTSELRGHVCTWAALRSARCPGDENVYTVPLDSLSWRRDDAQSDFLSEHKKKLFFLCYKKITRDFLLFFYYFCLFLSTLLLRSNYRNCFFFLTEKKGNINK